MSVIQLDVDKCVGCNTCVRACPVIDANIAKTNEDGNLIINIDDNKCIKCGSCITACSHHARTYLDDTDRFFEGVGNREEIAVIMAPAFRVAFEDNWEDVLAWLRSQGVSRIYDVSFGADICTWAHIRLLDENPEAKMISQPCAAIVNYVLRHNTDLISHLSPVHSPMSCLGMYIRKYEGFHGKIAALSPCIAKIDEFKQTKIIDYNVTIEKFSNYLRDHKISIPKSATPFKFDAFEGLEGSIYSRPGGLMKNILIHHPNAMVLTSEGVEKVYHDLDTYLTQTKENRPNVFDVLNCAMQVLRSELKNIRLRFLPLCTLWNVMHVRFVKHIHETASMNSSTILTKPLTLRISKDVTSLRQAQNPAFPMRSLTGRFFLSAKRRRWSVTLTAMPADSQAVKRWLPHFVSVSTSVKTATNM